jgi:hypothetical protein
VIDVGIGDTGQRSSVLLIEVQHGLAAAAATGRDYAEVHGRVDICEAERQRRRKFFCSSAIYA